mmetsp:Transcript_87292/g.145142  ORF Transcript_87292/g.145142 Transcript_87292/m.145142 type:complete len:271 (-) Transcript_87292:2709-3521(-)
MAFTTSAPRPALLRRGPLAGPYSGSVRSAVGRRTALRLGTPPGAMAQGPVKAQAAPGRGYARYCVRWAAQSAAWTAAFISKKSALGGSVSPSNGSFSSSYSNSNSISSIFSNAFIICGGSSHVPSLLGSVAFSPFFRSPSRAFAPFWQSSPHSSGLHVLARLSPSRPNTNVVHVSSRSSSVPSSSSFASAKASGRKRAVASTMRNRPYHCTNCRTAGSDPMEAYRGSVAIISSVFSTRKRSLVTSVGSMGFMPRPCTSALKSNSVMLALS